MKALVAREYPHVRLWARDFSILYSGDMAGAEVFVKEGDSFNATIDYAESWKQRWSGRIERYEGKIHKHDARAYLEYVTTWWNPVV